jgi:hypothetical protein
MECTNQLIFTAKVDKRYSYRLVYEKMLTRMRIFIHVISNLWYQNVYKSSQKRANECIFTAKVDNITIQKLMSKEKPMRMRICVSFTFTFKWENVRNSLQKCVDDLIFTVLVDSTCIYVYKLIQKNMHFFSIFLLHFFPFFSVSCLTSP